MTVPLFRLLLLLFSALMANALSHGTAAAQTNCAATDPTLISIGSGSNTLTICGTTTTNPNVYAYPGVQYAQAGRWQAPVQTALPTSGSMVQAAFGPACPQGASPNIMVTSENCLYLNIWKPKTATSTSKLPVMVFIHGGAFISGAGSISAYDGTAFAAQNVILVTINYRLGAFGFLTASMPTSSTNSTTTTIAGNFGLSDQLTALKWVKANITNFGGDPTKVTIFGESAGAMSVGLHAISVSASNGLFAGAIMESNPMGNAYPSVSSNITNMNNNFINTFCTNISSPTDCSSHLNFADMTNPAIFSAAQVLQAQNAASPAIMKADIENLNLGLPWAPVVNDSTYTNGLVAGQPYAGYAKGVTQVPIAFGTNANEGTAFGAMGYQGDPGFFTPNSFGVSLYDGVVTALLVKSPLTLLPKYLGSSSAYAAASNLTTYSMPPAAYAFSQLATDFFFNCGNMAAASMLTGNAITGTSFANTPSTTNSKIFGYQFNQPPILDIFAVRDGSAVPECSPVASQTLQSTTYPTSNICHASELPYVFNTITPTYGTYIGGTGQFQVPAAHTALASNMLSAWVAFATNPSSPGNAWVQFTGGSGNVGVWNINTPSGTAPSTTPLATNANCGLFLIDVIPYSAYFKKSS